jgi:hypothetical protein
MTDAPITRSTFDGRGLVTSRWNEGATEDVDGWPEVAADAARAVNHLTGGAHFIPAPVVYNVLGNLGTMAHRLPQGYTQLAAGLQRSLAALTVTDSRGNPATNVAEAVEALQRAAALAEQMAAALTEAQQAIAGQGYE